MPVQDLLESSQRLRTTERLILDVCVQFLGELSSKFHEIARPDRLPYESHGVKEEGQIVMRYENTRKHLT